MYSIMTEAIVNTTDKKKFAFKIGEYVKINLSEIAGEVIGQVRYQEGSNQYLVKYLNGTGDVSTTWFYASDLTRID